MGRWEAVLTESKDSPPAGELEDRFGIGEPREFVEQVLLWLDFFIIILLENQITILQLNTLWHLQLFHRKVETPVSERK